MPVGDRNSFVRIQFGQNTSAQALKFSQLVRLPHLGEITKPTTDDVAQRGLIRNAVLQGRTHRPSGSTTSGDSNWPSGIRVCSAPASAATRAAAMSVGFEAIGRASR